MCETVIVRPWSRGVSKRRIAFHRVVFVSGNRDNFTDKEHRVVLSAAALVSYWFYDSRLLERNLCKTKLIRTTISQRSSQLYMSQLAAVVQQLYVSPLNVF